MKERVKKFLNKHGYYRENQILEKLLDIRCIETPFGQSVKVTTYELNKIFGINYKEMKSDYLRSYKGKIIELIK